MKTFNKEIQDATSPVDALNILKEGNKRFVAAKAADRVLLDQVKDTTAGQWPHSVVLSCIDSRVPAEIVFDQGIGDIFSARVAGNIVNEDVLGSIEYGCKVAGSKLVVVLGHSKCGAVTAACNNVELGNISKLLEKIKPAVDLHRTGVDNVAPELIEEVALDNVKLSKQQILSDSPILEQMNNAGEIDLIGASYDVNTGRVVFFE